MRASPALASHAENVSNSMESFKEAKDSCSWDHVETLRNKDTRRSSRQSSKDSRWRRFIITPTIPRKKRENSTVVRIFIGRS